MNTKITMGKRRGPKRKPSYYEALKMINSGKFSETAIAKTTGYTRQRIHQIRKELGKEVKKEKYPNSKITVYCMLCGKEMVYDSFLFKSKKYKGLCRDCYHKVTGGVLMKCKICGEKFYAPSFMIDIKKGDENEICYRCQRKQEVYRKVSRKN